MAKCWILLVRVSPLDPLPCVHHVVILEHFQNDAAPCAGPKVVSTMSVGFDHIDIEECKSRGIPVGHTPDVLTGTTADLTVALLTATARRIPEAAAAVKNGEWSTWKPMWLTGKDIHSSTVGIVGLGRIGVAVAQRMRGFGCRILYTGASGPKPDVAEPLEAEYRDKHDLLAESDFVVILCALSKETYHFIDREALRTMKSDAILINAARGDIVDGDALAEALRSGEIAAAGLDVTSPEPLPAEHPLVQLPNCVVLPHIGSATRETRELIGRMSVDNLLAGIGGEPLPFAVPGTQS